MEKCCHTWSKKCSKPLLSGNITYFTTSISFLRTVAKKEEEAAPSNDWHKAVNSPKSLRSVELPAIIILLHVPNFFAFRQDASAFTVRTVNKEKLLFYGASFDFLFGPNIRSLSAFLLWLCMRYTYTSGLAIKHHLLSPIDFNVEDCASGLPLPGASTWPKH